MGHTPFIKEENDMATVIKVEGMTLEGAAKRLKGEKKDVINKARMLESLKGIRQQLSEIRETL